ncbi:MAG: FHA domain-containing protein [Elusimicrobia bacterium]|nr:FHA domain-containing protein [Elusimicrobiota bacterium]
MPKIILKFGAAVIKEIPITNDVTTIGRKSDNDIVIDNPAISGHHAKIYKQDNSYFVEDLGSTNGTFLNETKIVKADLRNKGQIGIAKHTLIFINEETNVQPSEKKEASGSETVVIDSAKLRELTGGKEGDSASQGEKVGTLKVIDGAVDQTEIELPGLLTYIGSGSQAQVKIKGMFAPALAAAISRRPEGYILKAIKEGYPKVNTVPVNDQKILTDGDMLEFGKTKMVFMEKVKK